ncbi:MAG: addiction module protein [Planctomycetaceae bacterium]
MSDRFSAITKEALSLSPNERMDMALMLWDSLSDHDRGERDSVDPDLIAEIRRRNAEMESGAVQGRSHAEVMAAARKALGCG